MKHPSENQSQEVLAGLVERVTYDNAENGFCVLRAKARGHRDVVTVVGHAATIAAGEWITASGEWVNDRTHGQQFKARFLRTSPPTSADGIEKYLSSGMIRGIGPAYAKKLLRAFGEKVFDRISFMTQHYAMLQRNLLYTGVSRGKRLVVLVGQKKAVAIAVRNVSSRRRWSKLAERGRLEELRECMTSGVTVPPWRSRVYLASGKVGNKSIASFRACFRHVRFTPNC
jgi:ATP-dependent exoDNAse (exonuclease V) alpha subunit